MRPFFQAAAPSLADQARPPPLRHWPTRLQRRCRGPCAQGVWCGCGLPERRCSRGHRRRGARVGGGDGADVVCGWAWRCKVEQRCGGDTAPTFPNNPELEAVRSQPVFNAGVLVRWVARPIGRANKINDLPGAPEGGCINDPNRFHGIINDLRSGGS